MKKQSKIFLILSMTLLPLIVFSCRKKDNVTVNEPSKPAEEKDDIKKEAPEIFNMVYVKGGWCTIGLTEEEKDKYFPDSKSGIYTRHNSYVSDFMISSSEITQDLYEQVMEQNPSLHAGAYRPVELVKFTDALIFCNKLSIKENLTPCYSLGGETDPSKWDLFWDDSNSYRLFERFILDLKCDFNCDGYRLPTEAEWMYAAKGGEHNESFFYSGSDNLDAVAVISSYENQTSYDCPQVVKSKLPNSLGLYDMSGNLKELVWDYYGKFPVSDIVNYTGPQRILLSCSEYSVLKGGDYEYSSEYQGYIEKRDSIYLKGDWDVFGFRVCRSVNSEQIKKEAAKAEEKARENRDELLKLAVLPKIIKLPDFTYLKNEKYLPCKGMYVSKSPLSFNDLFLKGPECAGDLLKYDSQSSTVFCYNAILYLNELSRICGLKPYYSIMYAMNPEKPEEFTKLNENQLKELELDYIARLSDYASIMTIGGIDRYKRLRVSFNPDSNGFRFPTEEEHDALFYLSIINLPENSVEKPIRKYIDITGAYDLECWLLSYTASVKDTQITRLTDTVSSGDFYFCRNIPESEKEIKEFDSLVTKYTNRKRVERALLFEKLIGVPMDDLMVKIKGGTALQSLDFNNGNFSEVTLGSYSMSKIPFTKKMLSALIGASYDNSNHDEDQPLEMSWYEAALICNNLSDIYGLKKVYKFCNMEVFIDYTADGFRMPTEAEWEHAARSGTKDKSTKYGIPLEDVIYYQNKKYYTHISDEWESYWKLNDFITVYSGTPNALGIYNLVGYCAEWCNDRQTFDSHAFSDKNPSYKQLPVDINPYYAKKMPGGQIAGQKRIIKGEHYVNSEYYDNARISIRDTVNDTSHYYALRLVRTTNTEEMKKLMKEHENEYLEMLASNKPFFDQNLKMVTVKGKKFADRKSDGEESKYSTLEASDFMIADCEVTNEMFIRIMHYYPNYDAESNASSSIAPDAPVTNITLKEAKHFCNELSRMYGFEPCYDLEKDELKSGADGFRLPTEDEWLLAAMEGNPKYKPLYSGSNNPEEVAVFETSTVQPVKTKKPNRLGLYDMSGNAFELLEGDHIRGGSVDYRDFPIYKYYSWSGTKGSDDTGFRVVRSVK